MVDRVVFILYLFINLLKAAVQVSWAVQGQIKWEGDHEWKISMDLKGSGRGVFETMFLHSSAKNKVWCPYQGRNQKALPPLELAI
jgi:hypothetical protein